MRICTTHSPADRKHFLRILAALALLAFAAAAPGFGQEAAPDSETDDSFFDGWFIEAEPVEPDDASARDVYGDSVFGEDPFGDDIFGTEEEMVEATEETGAIRDAFLQTEGVSIGGTFSGTLDLNATWTDPWNGEAKPFDPDRYGLSPGAGASLGFSAKPATDLGFYGEVRTSYPFVKTINGVTVPDISVFKLYSKFSMNDAVFFTFGKQPLKWGKGYFFAPANDLLSLSAVDFDDPEAEREGPLSLRMNVPVPGILASASLIMVFGGTRPKDTVLAPKFEIAFPGVELSAAAYYRYDDPPKLIAGASIVKDELSLFGEGLVSFGSERIFIEPDGNTVKLAERPDDLFFTGTAGLVYRKSWEKKLELLVAGQYIYDGEGQPNISLTEARQGFLLRLGETPTEQLMKLAELTADPVQLASAVAPFGSRLGRHYGALSLNAGKIAGSDVSFSVFALANLADLSGMVKPQITWQVFDRLSVSLWSIVSFGGEGDEYTNMSGIFGALSGNTAPVIQAGIGFSLGSGSF
jgi:hypothetical protein